MMHTELHSVFEVSDGQWSMHSVVLTTTVMLTTTVKCYSWWIIPATNMQTLQVVNAIGTALSHCTH